MTNEEFDRKVEFLLDQQARFHAGMQDLQEAQAISEQKIAKAADAASLAVEAVTQLIDVTAHLANTMFEGFRTLFDSMKHTDEKIDALVDAQIRSDEKLRETFERHLRDHHNGRNGALEN